MATIVRIKRKLNEEPLDAVLLNCKRRKIEAPSNASEDKSAVFTFIGTAKTPDEDILKHIDKSTKTVVGEKYKKHVSNITEKLRQQTASASKSSRFKVINCHRSINEDSKNDTEENERKQNYTIYDIETDQEENKENNPNSLYLYDLYYAHWEDFQQGVEDNELISVYPLSDQLVYGSYRDNGIDERDGESEDSNEENNWRNDYPDESDLESITDEDMLCAVNRIDLDHENSLSSDDDECMASDKSIDKEISDKEDTDQEDVDRYGKLYAKFKARVRTEEKYKNKSLYCGDIDEDEHYYY